MTIVKLQLLFYIVTDVGKGQPRQGVEKLKLLFAL